MNFITFLKESISPLLFQNVQTVLRHLKKKLGSQVWWHTLYLHTFFSSEWLMEDIVGSVFFLCEGKFFWIINQTYTTFKTPYSPSSVWYLKMYFRTSRILLLLWTTKICFECSELHSLFCIILATIRSVRWDVFGWTGKNELRFILLRNAINGSKYSVLKCDYTTWLR